jgi:DNA invertase Pin-like site-specific DNA recombinase
MYAQPPQVQKNHNVAVSYIRFSSMKQAQGASLQRQLEATQAYCQRHGLTLDESLSSRDLGVSAWSGANTERGALGRFLELVKNGHVRPGTRLIVENLDRLSRQAPLDAFETIRQLLKAGIVIVTLMDNQEYDTDSVNGGQVFVLLGHLQRAHQESQTKSERVKDAWARKRRNAANKPITANCPGWLRMKANKSGYELVPERVKTIKRILQLIVDGQGYETTSKLLNHEQVPLLVRSRLKKAQCWQTSTIAKLVGNRHLIGEYQPHVGKGKNRKPIGDPIPDYFPAAVSKSLFYSSLEARNSRRSKPGRPCHRVNLLSGLVFDLKGSSWAATKKGHNDVQRIVSTKARAGVPGHEYKTIPMEQFENAILLLIHQVWEKRVAVDNPVENNIAELRGQIADIDARLDTLRHKIKTSDPSTIATLIDLVPEMEAEKSNLLIEIEKQESKQNVQSRNMPSLYEELQKSPKDLDLRKKIRQLLQESISKIKILAQEKVSSKRIPHPMTGKLYRPKGGQHVAVAIEMADGGVAFATMFLPCRQGDIQVRLLGGDEATQTNLIQNMIDKLTPVDMVDDHVVFKVE